MREADPDVQRFAQNLREARAKAGFSQIELGNACNLHPTAIARLELAQRNPRVTTLTKLARGLGITTSDLVRGL